MPDRAQHIGLDNPAFHGRLRSSFGRPQAPPDGRYFRQVMELEPPEPVELPGAPDANLLSDVLVKPKKAVYERAQFLREPVQIAPNEVQEAQPIEVVQAQPFALPAASKQQPSTVLKRQFVSPQTAPAKSRSAKVWLKSYSKTQLGLVGMACLVFVVGLSVSLQTLQTNHTAAAQVAVLSKQASSSTSDKSNQAAVPSTVKPSAQAVSQYVVAPDLARYLKIPKLGVDARVLQVGVTSSGALGTPNNVYDTAWYTGSAKPGETGATLIDGHVSSWTTHGVFYGIKTLAAGDSIQIVRGDGTVLNYQVVKTQVYSSDNVDMQAAVTSVVPGKSGLNLITCTGQVEKGTSEFNERVIVFAVLQS